MTEYEEAQIIKHALAYYIQRPDADKEDLKQECRLLNKYVEKVVRLRKKYRINEKIEKAWEQREHGKVLRDTK